MEDVLLYMAAFFMVFLSCAVVCFCLRFSFWIYSEYWSRNQDQRQQHHILRYPGNHIRDRQTNNFAQANEAGRDNRCNDIFFIEPNSQEAARIRAQLEKDDKELPSYDEVMRIANSSPPTAAPPAMPVSLSSISTNDTIPIPTLPLYREGSSNVRPLTPPPYTAEPIGATVVLPISTSLHSQQNTHSS